MRSLVYYVATSLDGFIADADGDFSAFPQDPETLAALFARYPETCPGHLRDALGVTAAPRRFDTVLMGYRTYEPALAAGLADGAYPHLDQLVVSHRRLAVPTLSGDVRGRVAELKARGGGDLWLCGGGDLAGQLVNEIDELQLKLNPIALGSGIGLFGSLPTPRTFTLVESEALPAGVLLTTYRRD